MQNNPKQFMLDVSVLKHNPEALEGGFGDNTVVLAMSTVDEIAKLNKKGSSEERRKMRRVIRRLDVLRQEGNLHEGIGVECKGKGSVRIYSENDLISLPAGFTSSNDENKVLQAAYTLHKGGLSKSPSQFVKLISLNKTLRIKANTIGLPVGEYNDQKIELGDLFDHIKTQEVDLDFIKSFQSENKTLLNGFDLKANEFISFSNEFDPSVNILAREKLGEIIHVKPEFDRNISVRPRNMGQRMAVDLLLDRDVQLVSLIGKAGTGKTLLSTAAGLSQAFYGNDFYDKLLVSRPIIPMGKDIGYLPGTKDEKLFLWMQPVFDNLAIIIENSRESLLHALNSRSKGKNSVKRIISDMMKSRRLELEALTYIRGRSMPRQFVIIDDAQNLTPHEMKTIISRAGENTKMVFCGDPEQIDNPNLDKDSNGLSYLVAKLTGQVVYGHVTLTEGEKGDLSSIAMKAL